VTRAASPHVRLALAVVGMAERVHRAIGRGL